MNYGIIQIGLLGAQGKMGKWVNNLIHSEFSERTQLKAQASRGDSLLPLLETDVIIDFSSSSALTSLATAALEKSSSKNSDPLPAFVVGSTGWDQAQPEILQRLAQKTPVLMSANFSTGVLAVEKILRQYSSLLTQLGYTPVIVESHHRFKKDAPSGTALTLQRAVNEKHPEQIQTHSIRAGEVIGDHEVTFYGTGDQISIRHFAQDRSIFARGAIQAALWLHEKRSTLPRNLLGIRDYFNSFQDLTPKI